MTDFLFERIVAAYRGGEQIAIAVGERDGYVVLKLALVGDDTTVRACLLEPMDARAVMKAIEDSIGRAKVKRES